MLEHLRLTVPWGVAWRAGSQLLSGLALALALWDAVEMAGSAAQLGLNLVGMVMAGVCVIALQRLLWSRVLALSERLIGTRAERHDTMPA